MQDDEVMGEADEPDEVASEPADDSINPLPSSPAPVRDKGSKRFRVTTSSAAGTLAAVARDKEGAAKPYREVAQRILSDGYLRLVEAADLLGKKHTGRALEKLLSDLPVVAFASSRKDGWLLVPKDEEQYATIQTLIQRSAEQQETNAEFGNLSREEFSDVAAVSSPTEKLLMRYLLARIYGVEEAAERFGLARATLEKDFKRIAEALNAVAALEPADGNESTQSASTYKQRQVFHQALQQEQHGGRQAWEKDKPTKDAVMQIVNKAVRGLSSILSCMPSCLVIRG